MALGLGLQNRVKIFCKVLYSLYLGGAFLVDSNFLALKLFLLGLARVKYNFLIPNFAMSASLPRFLVSKRRFLNEVVLLYQTGCNDLVFTCKFLLLGV